MNIFETDDNSTPLTEEEKQGLKAGWITNRSELNEMETAGIAEAEIWLMTNKKDILSESFLKTLHKKMFGEVWLWAGSFRTTERNIGVAPYNIQPELRKIFDDIKYWIENNTYPQKEIAIRFHHRLVQIHPFPNGNGRISRLMADLLMRKFGLYEIYMQDCEDENEFKKWKQYFTPEKIRKIIDEYENTVDKNFNLYDFRKRVYKNLSQTAHNSCLDLNLGCFGVDFNNEEYLRYNIAGVISKDMKQTINPVIYSTGIFLLYITTILCDLRKMKFYVNKKDGDVPYLVALEIYKELFYDYALKNAKI